MVDKTVLNQNSVDLWHFLQQQKQVHLNFQISYFLESGSIHSEMCGLSNVGINLSVCIVHVMISINKYLLSLFNISVNQL